MHLADSYETNITLYVAQGLSNLSQKLIRPMLTVRTTQEMYVSHEISTGGLQHCLQWFMLITLT